MPSVANPPANGSCPRKCSCSALFLDVITHRASNSFPSLDYLVIPFDCFGFGCNIPYALLRCLASSFLRSCCSVSQYAWRRIQRRTRPHFSLDLHWSVNVSINHRLEWHSTYYNPPEEQKDKKENKKRLNSTWTASPGSLFLIPHVSCDPLFLRTSSTHHSRLHYLNCY